MYIHHDNVVFQYVFRLFDIDKHLHKNLGKRHWKKIYQNMKEVINL